MGIAGSASESGPMSPPRAAERSVENNAATSTKDSPCKIRVRASAASARVGVVMILNVKRGPKRSSRAWLSIAGVIVISGSTSLRSMALRLSRASNRAGPRPLRSRTSASRRAAWSGSVEASSCIARVSMRRSAVRSDSEMVMLCSAHNCARRRSSRYSERAWSPAISSSAGSRSAAPTVSRPIRTSA